MLWHPVHRPSHGAHFAKKLCEFLANLESASSRSGKAIGCVKTIGCLLNEKTIKDKKVGLAASPEKPLKGERKNSGVTHKIVCMDCTHLFGLLCSMPLLMGLRSLLCFEWRFLWPSLKIYLRLQIRFHENGKMPYRRTPHFYGLVKFARCFFQCSYLFGLFNEMRDANCPPVQVAITGWMWK
jgi:hypothetical protein